MPCTGCCNLKVHSSVTCKMGIFVVGVNHPFEKIFSVMLTKGKYRVPSRIPTTLPESPPCSFQTNGGLVLGIKSGPLTSLSFPNH